MIKKVILVVVAFAIGFFGFRYFYDKYKTTDEENSVVEETMVEQEEEEWITLFDGSSFDGWHEYNSDTITSVWTLEEGAMTFTPNKEIGGNHTLVTNRKFTNFVLSLEWKISKNGNSGVFWGVYEDEKYGRAYSTGPEVQVLDDDGHPDGKIPSHRAGSLYDMIVPPSGAVKPVGEWNTLVITVDHEANKGSVMLNGTETASFPVNGPAWDAMVADSKFKDWEGFGVYRTGKIGVQDHGDVVSFRNIKIKEL